MSKPETGPQRRARPPRPQAPVTERGRLWMHMRAPDDVLATDPAATPVEGKGCYVTMADGRSYLEAMGGLFVLNLGHGREEIIEAVAQQLRTLSYANPARTPAPSTRALAEKIASLAPGDLNYVVFTNTGSDAVETALKLARQYHRLRGQAGRYKFVARTDSYHGATFGAMSVTGYDALHPDWFGPLLPHTAFAPQPDCYRCPLQKRYPTCGIACADAVADVIEREGPDTVAAFIGEPVSLSAGVAIPPPEYWPRVREICDRYGVLLIHDEVLNGFGRLGRWFGSEHWGVQPDIATFAKGVTSGYQPLGGVIASEKVASAFRERPGSWFAHVSTFGGHPAATAAGLKNLEIIEREGLVANAATMGERLLAGLRSMAREHPSIGDVRGIGLLAAVDFVADHGSRARFDPSSGFYERIQAALADQGLLCRVTTVIQLSPPLIVGDREVEHIVRGVDQAVGEVERERGLH